MPCQSAVAAADVVERRSRRTRKGRTSITVSNTTTLEQLKLQIFESLSIHPKNQTVG